MGTWTEIIHLIETHHRFVITSHVNPDGDAIGSELGLAHHLLALGKEVAVFNSDATPKAYRFLDGIRRVRTFSKKRYRGRLERADVIFVLDASGGWDRLGRIGKWLAKTRAVKVCIDHHADPVDFVDVAVVDPAAAATAELIFELIRAMEGEISQAIADALYVAILTDTGSFRFPKTSPRTHHIAGQLMLAGADPGTLYRKIYNQYPLALLRLKGRVMDSLQVTAGGQLAYAALEQATLKAYGVAQRDLDGFAGLGQRVAGVRLNLLFVETAKRQVKVSLRSDGSLAINDLAARWGGGGHPSAAGAIVAGTLDEVVPRLVGEARALLARG
ncbi:MAG: bifunctional oligoribonuclease/PAP phosphatase NrnA [Anaerolineae bacterium]